jgi:hypothetical protein
LAKIGDEGANSQLLFVLLEWLVICDLQGKLLSHQKHKWLWSGMSRFKKPFATLLQTMNLSRLYFRLLFPQNKLGENSITKNTN